jgi:ketosteroid isomerase-like protein
MGHLAETAKKGFEAANRGDLDAVMDLLSLDIEFYDLGRPPVHGQADVRAALDRILVAFPDQRTTVRNLIESGDWLVAEVTFSGTNLGPAQGPAGNEIPATGKRVAIEAATSSDSVSASWRRIASTGTCWRSWASWG